MEQKQVIDELNYHRAQKITEMLYQKELITFEEYEKLTLKNREVFSPVLVELLPKPQKIVPETDAPVDGEWGEAI